MIKASTRRLHAALPPSHRSAVAAAAANHEEEDDGEDDDRDQDSSSDGDPGPEGLLSRRRAGVRHRVGNGDLQGENQGKRSRRTP